MTKTFWWVVSPAAEKKAKAVKTVIIKRQRTKFKKVAKRHATSEWVRWPSKFTSEAASVTCKVFFLVMEKNCDVRVSIYVLGVYLESYIWHAEE